MEKLWVFLCETTATAHLAILSRACLAGAGRDLGSLDPVNGGYLFAAIVAAISAFRPRPCFLGPHDDLHDEPVRRQDRSRRGAANFCSPTNLNRVTCNSGPREMQQGFAN